MWHRIEHHRNGNRMQRCSQNARPLIPGHGTTIHTDAILKRVQAHSTSMKMATEATVTLTAFPFVYAKVNLTKYERPELVSVILASLHCLHQVSRLSLHLAYFLIEWTAMLILTMPKKSY